MAAQAVERTGEWRVQGRGVHDLGRAHARKREPVLAPAAQDLRETRKWYDFVRRRWEKGPLKSHGRDPRRAWEDALRRGYVGDEARAQVLEREGRLPDAVLACYPDAGIIPYLTRLRTVDFGRLNDTYLARSARSEQDVVDYFFRVRPDALVMTHVGGLSHGFDAAANQLLRDPRFGEYQRVSYRHAKDAGVALYTRQ